MGRSISRISGRPRRRWPRLITAQRDERRCSPTNMPASSKARTCGRISRWRKATCTSGTRHSTYIHHPPFFQTLTLDVPHISDIQGARVLALLGELDHHRPHFPGRQYRRRQPGGKIPAGARRAGARLQPVRHPARQ